MRWRLDFFRRYALGFVLLGLAFGLIFLPYALFSVKDNWQGFTGRAQETSIFSPQNQPQAFAQYGMPYDPALGRPAAGAKCADAIPLPWAQVRRRAVARDRREVHLQRGDPTAVLSDPRPWRLACWPRCGRRWRCWAWPTPPGKSGTARFGLVSIWFWGGMLGAALTMDTPSVQRLTGAWPVADALPRRRCWTASGPPAWPLSRALARRWATVPAGRAARLLRRRQATSEYFVHYAALCPYCTPTTQARYAQALGQDYKAYQLGVGDYDVFFSYGSTRFAAKGVEGEDLAVPADFFPITDNNGKGAAFIVYGPNADYLPLIRLFYPGGARGEPIEGADGAPSSRRTRSRAQQMAAFQTLHATYTPASGAAVTRR